MTVESTDRDGRSPRSTGLSPLLIILIAVVAAFLLFGLVVVVGLVGFFTITSSTGSASPPIETTIPGSPVPVVVPPEEPSGGPAPVVDTPTPSLLPPYYVQAVRSLLAAQLRVDPEKVRVVSWEQVDWPDGCLGITVEQTMCTEAIVPGYRVLLQVDGRGAYEYRSNLDGSLIMLATAPPTGIERPALIWEGRQPEEGMCQRLVLAPNGEALVGPCGAPPAPLRISGDLDRLGQLEYLLGRFSPFTAGEVEFYGQGTEQAAPGWQRAIGEWGQLVQRELRMGRGGASWALALAWDDSNAEGRCRHLQVERYGNASASTFQCGGGGPEAVARGWLSDAELDQLYEWLDRLDLVEASTGSGRVLLSGEGHAQSTHVEAERLAEWAAGLHGRLADEGQR